MVSTLQFGIKGDGVANDTTKFNAARAAARAAKTTLYVHGVVKITATLVVSTIEKWVGNGFTTADLTVPTGSSILWGGAAGGTMVRVTSPNMFGGGMEGIVLDAASLAATCLIVQESSGGHYSQCSLINFTTGDGLVVKGGLLAAQGNIFDQLYVDGLSGINQNGHSGIWLTGTPEECGNACLNVFIKPQVFHGGNRPGWLLGMCDNNTIFSPFNQRQPDGSGEGFLCDPTENETILCEYVAGQFPCFNRLYHVQAGLGGWVQPSGCFYPTAIIDGYHRDNGAPLPVTNGSPLIWTDEYGALHTPYGLVLSGGLPGNALAITVTPDTENAVANDQQHADFAARSHDYATSTKETRLRQYGPTATGTTAGISNASLAQLMAQNTLAFLIGSNNNIPIHFAPNGTPILRLTGAGIFMPTIPTSDPGVEGQLWTNFGVLNRSAG